MRGEGFRNIIIHVALEKLGMKGEGFIYTWL